MGALYISIQKLSLNDPVTPYMYTGTALYCTNMDSMTLYKPIPIDNQAISIYPQIHTCRDIAT